MGIHVSLTVSATATGSGDSPQAKGCTILCHLAGVWERLSVYREIVATVLIWRFGKSIANTKVGQIHSGVRYSTLRESN